MIEDGLVELLAVNTFAEAAVIRSALEAHGIEALLPDEHITLAMGGAFLGTGGIRVMVDAHDAAQARRILSELEREAAGRND